MANKANTAKDIARVNVPAVIDHALIARMVIRDGKPFKEAALAGGYSEAVARMGLKSAMQESAPLSRAVEAEWKLLETNVVHLKPLAVARLYREIVDPNSVSGIRAIEVAGKFKEADWFVRAVGDIQIGIVNSLAAVETETTLTEYKEPTE